MGDKYLVYIMLSKYNKNKPYSNIKKVLSYQKKS